MSVVFVSRKMSRRTDTVFSVLQYAVMLVALLCLFGVGGGSVGEVLVAEAEAALVAPAATQTESAAVSRRLEGAVKYIQRRYKVSPDALMPVFEAAEATGRAHRLDPTLILAVIGVESSFNPYAESTMGARGLMQVIPRFHMDKVPAGMGEQDFFDPAVNVRIGVQVLEEAIRRRGDLVAGLQYYGGSTDPNAWYARRVLAEKERLDRATLRSVSSGA